MTQAKVTVVIPVYADWPSLKLCIESLDKFVSPPHKVLLVNDCGPDADVIEKNIKAAITGKDMFEYQRNPKNLGFVGACNRAALELDKTTNDIMLLNSDTVATEGFLDELLAVLYASPKNGAVSPRSNNASHATFPTQAAHIKGIDKDKAYKLWTKTKDSLPRSSEVPTAHGFCILIKRPLIKKYGLFDTVFGQGYGEEVDFCQRIIAKGYKCLLANRAFVFHLEAKSFSLEKKRQLMDEHNQIIWQRHPDYRQNVRDYMDKTIPAEAAIFKKLGLSNGMPQEDHLKTFIKGNRYLYKIARKLKNLAS